MVGPGLIRKSQIRADEGGAKFGHEFLLASITTPAGQILYQAVPYVGIAKVLFVVFIVLAVAMIV